MEVLGAAVLPIWDVGVTGGGLTWSTMLLTPGLSLAKSVPFGLVGGTVAMG